MAERLARELVGDLTAVADGVGRRVLVWFDPAEEFDRLAPSVSATLSAHRVDFVRFDPGDESQLALKVRLLRVESQAGPQVVVYVARTTPRDLLPGSEGSTPRLWALAEYPYKGAVWNGGSSVSRVGRWDAPPTLLAEWLQRNGVVYADGATSGELSRGGNGSRLARYAAKNADVDPAAWPRPLRVRDVEEALGGDPRNAVFELLANPTTAISTWGEEAPDVWDRIGTEYGYRPTGSSAEPERLRDEFIGLLALTEAWDAFGQPSDFPFAARLPKGPQQRGRAMRLVREDILRRGDLEPVFRQRVAAQEAEWGALDSWAAPLEGHPVALPALLRRRLRATVSGLEASTREQRWDGLESLKHHLPDASLPLGPLTRDVVALHEVVRLGDGCADALSTLDRKMTAADLVAAYAGGWWRNDRAYLRVQAALANDPSLAPARILADRIYAEYLVGVNDRFSAAVEEAGEWPPAGTAAAALPGWKADSKQPGAVIISDAMRLDIGQLVVERIGPSARVEIGMSTLPSTTPFGMAALMPGMDAPLTADLGRSARNLDTDDGLDLASRTGRRQHLAQVLRTSAGPAAIEFVELDELLNGTKRPKAALTVIFDYALDDRGHGQGSLPEYAEDHAAKIAIAVDRLHELGARRVDVVTDHGFLHVDPEIIEALGRPQLPHQQVVHRSGRYAILAPDAGVGEVFRLPCPLVPDLQLGFPRGIRTLSKAKEYLHGGVSLQECVIPHIISEAAAARTRLGAEIVVSSPRLTGGTVFATVRAVFPTGQLTLAGVRPLRVRLTVELPDGDEPLAGPVDVLLRLDAPEVPQALYLAEGRPVAAGTSLSLMALDADTKEELARVPLSMLVDWE